MKAGFIDKYWKIYGLTFYYAYLQKLFQQRKNIKKL